MDWIRGIAIHVVLIGMAAPCAAESLAPAYGAAVDQLAGYCMGSVCLGMSMQDVAKLGTLEFKQWTPPKDPQPICDPLMAGRGGLLRTSSGERAHLTFELVGATGAAASRYRVVGITRTFPELSLYDVHSMSRQLVKRFGGMKRVINPQMSPDNAQWKKSVGNFELTVAYGKNDQLMGPFDQLGRTISVSGSVSQDWLYEQAACEPPEDPRLPKL